MLLPHPAWSDDRGKVAGAVVGKVGVTHSRINSPRRAEGLRNSLPLQDVSTVARTDGGDGAGRGPLARPQQQPAEGRAAPGHLRRQPVAMLVAHALTVDRCMQEDPMRARFATIPVVEQGVQVCSSMPARCSTDTTQHAAAAKTDATPP